MNHVRENMRQLYIYIFKLPFTCLLKDIEIGETKEIVFVSKNIDDYIRKVFMISVQHK